MKKIYQLPNPLWLDDIFIFSEEDKDVWCYIKINYRNKIEEIGSDISYRLHRVKMEDIIDSASEATKLQRSIYNRIDEEYWWKVRKEYKKINI